jgi:hypothetical protein
MINDIIAELNLENGSNYKIAVLKKHTDNQLLKTVLKMTYDKVDYTFGITMKNISYQKKTIELELSDGIDLLKKLSKREFTGNAAKERVEETLSRLSDDDANVITKIINRDLRISVGKTQINKVFKNLITKPSYMRCDVYSPKTAKNITLPAVIQLKADGTYREFNVFNGLVSARSRSGESYDYPILFKEMKNYKDGIYTGELVIRGSKTRQVGNGLINSDNPPHEDIVAQFWDWVPHEEYETARSKDKKNPCTLLYKDRYKTLTETVKESNNVELIESYEVDSVAEALKFVCEWMNDGYEGGVLKSWDMPFKDGTSNKQLKIKLKIDAEVRITGFTEGSGKNADYFGAITFDTDDQEIKGKVGVSSMTEDLRDWFHTHRTEVTGKIMTVQFNDISKGRSSDHYAFSHPRFIEIRDDKDETDTLDRVFKLKEMAMNLS